jgi:acyl-[acyl-carrier-protein]-phospholipid O-acyltransferase / long-chain-fatty-acid--[acyl-carrier-protein] ligase
MKNQGYLSLIRQKGFAAFLATQFLGAFNDNLFKWTLTFLMLAGMVHGAARADASNLSSIAIVFILPTLLFSSLAGWLADNFEKRRVLVVAKSFEILLMLLAWLALRSGDFRLQLGVLFLLATQFTFFSPAKYGVVPEWVDDAGLSLANGLLEMSTYLAILLGSVLAAPLFKRFSGDLDSAAEILLAVAVLGAGLSLGMAPSRIPIPGQRVPFRWRLLWSEVWDGTKVMRQDARLWAANLGASYFWFQGAFLQLLAVLLAKQVLHFDEGGIAGLGIAMAVGVGVGSLLAGSWSSGEVELGLAPLGGLGMGIFSVLMALTARAYPVSVYASLGLLGLCAGLFVVPMNATLQQRAASDAKGRVQAAANVFSTLAMIVAALLVDLGSAGMGLQADTLLLLSGLFCFVVTVGLCLLLPEFVTRCVRWVAAHTRRGQKGQA